VIGPPNIISEEGWVFDHRYCRVNQLCGAKELPGKLNARPSELVRIHVLESARLLHTDQHVQVLRHQIRRRCAGRREPKALISVQHLFLY
jgi:hypothetical protein